MQKVRFSPIIGIAMLVVVVAPAVATAAGGVTRVPADFTGILIDATRDATVPVTLHVDSYTTADEVQSLAHSLGVEGQRGVVAALAQIKPRGWIRVGDMIGTLVPVIRSFDSDKGTRIFAVLDRPFPIFQQLQGTRSPDYPYGMVELKLNVDGNGNGTLVAAGRAIFADNGTILMESYGTKPYQIIGVTQQPVGK
jgi:hypothetical protein